jgi:Transposase zinc-ribbon domain
MPNVGHILLSDALATEEGCLDYLEALRWPDGVRCLRCGSDRVSRFVANASFRRRFSEKRQAHVVVSIPARRLYQCNSPGCRRQFSAITGTVFMDSRLPLRTWFRAVAMVAEAGPDVSAKEMERGLGVSYRTAWLLNHRIREALGREIPSSGPGPAPAEARATRGEPRGTT